MGTKLRRISWCMGAIIGIPAALYFPGPIWVLFVVAVSMFVAKWRVLDHIFAGVCVVATLFVVIRVGLPIPDHATGRFEWSLAWFLFCLSLVAMTIASAKLGRIAGHVLWRPVS